MRGDFHINSTSNKKISFLKLNSALNENWISFHVFDIHSWISLQIYVNDLGSVLWNVSIAGKVTKSLVWLVVIGNTIKSALDSHRFKHGFNQKLSFFIITDCYFFGGALCLVFDFILFLHDTIGILVVFGCLGFMNEFSKTNQTINFEW